MMPKQSDSIYHVECTFYVSASHILLCLSIQTLKQINNAGANKGFRPLLQFSDEDIRQVYVTVQFLVCFCQTSLFMCLIKFSLSFLQIEFSISVVISFVHSFHHNFFSFLVICRLSQQIWWDQ